MSNAQLCNDTLRKTKKNNKTLLIVHLGYVHTGKASGPVLIFFWLMCEKDIVYGDSSQCEQKKSHEFRSVLIRFGPLPYGALNAMQIGFFFKLNSLTFASLQIDCPHYYAQAKRLVGCIRQKQIWRTAVTKGLSVLCRSHNPGFI